MNRHPRDEDLRGWLRRKGSCMKTWSRRWFVLSDKFLFIYLRDDDKNSQDCITLNGQIIVESPPHSGDPRSGYFDIVTECDGGHNETLSLCAETEAEKKVWVRALKRVLYAEKGGALFSQSLEEILYWEGLEGRQIPYIVDECVEYLYKYGLDVEGIFRLPGRQSVAKGIIARFERGQKIKFEDEGTDVHVVASVLKAFLRSLPDSIIPCQLFQKFMNIALRFTKVKDEAARETSVQELAQAVKLIPKGNYTILKYICRFLREVGHHESTNKMSMMSLGTVFSYNILRHIDTENNQLVLMTTDLGQNLVYMLLKYYTQVFLHEHKIKEDTESKDPNKDLLHMSRIFDIPIILPAVSITSSSLADHKGLSLTTGSSVHNSTSSSWPRGVTDDVPAEHCKNDCEYHDVVTGNGSVSICATGIQNEEMKLLQPVEATSAIEHVGTRNGSSSLGENLNSAAVAFRQSRSRITRNSYVSGRRRPEAMLLDAGVWSPRDRHKSGIVNSDDVFIALARAKPSSPGSPVATSTYGLSCNYVSLDIDYASSQDAAWPTLDAAAAFEMEGKADSSITCLKNQITALKEELSLHRSCHRAQVCALKEQLTDLKEKYERRIVAVQTDYRLQIKELENKLREEKDIHADAIADCDRLQEKINKYQILYGKL